MFDSNMRINVQKISPRTDCSLTDIFLMQICCLFKMLLAHPCIFTDCPHAVEFSGLQDDF